MIGKTGDMPTWLSWMLKGTYELDFQSLVWGCGPCRWLRSRVQSCCRQHVWKSF